jgi:hypothetical protein
MFDGESPKELHRCLSALQVKLVDLGSTQCDGKWMKRKFFQALLPFMKERQLHTKLVTITGSHLRDARERSICFMVTDWNRCIQMHS